MELKFIQNVMKLLKASDIRELELEENNAKMYLKKGNGTPVVQKAVQEPVEEIVEIKEYSEVKSEYIGKYIYKNKEGVSTIKVGQEVIEGTKLGYVETMGIQNEVLSNANGKISEIIVKNGGLSDYGRILVKIEKN